MSVKQSQQGFTLIEVMIAFFILGVGLLGMAALLTNSVRSSQGAYYRTQAAYLAEDMADRIRANRSTIDYTSVTANNKNCVITSASATKSSNNCVTADMAAWDVFDWQSLLAAALPGGVGVVCLDSTPFDGSSDTAAACDGVATSAGGLIAVKVWWDANRDGAINTTEVGGVQDQRMVVTLR